LKFKEDAPAGFFAAEASGLAELRRADALKVPRVFAYCDTDTRSGPAFILLEALEPGDKGRPAQEAFGRGLAKLHSVCSDYFGFPTDNFIGSLLQLNAPQQKLKHSSWGEFFLAFRIRPQVRLGEGNGWFDRDFARILSKKESIIVEVLSEGPSEASLLHGDLWAGNIFWSSEGPALIDPAVHYGSREADLAFLELFGSPPSAVFGAYRELLPDRPGYSARRDILNLYHLMTHSNLFGGSYMSSAMESLRHI
jgi:fructosamine-3-kinase